MSRFTAPLIVTPLNDGKTWRIIASSEEPELNFGYELGHEGSGISIVPPNNFETDFASIPRLLWWLLPTWGKYGNAAVIHDALYQGYEIDDIDAPSWWPERKEADQIFAEGMAVLGVKRWKRIIIYWGVRLGGWWAWRKHHSALE